MYLCVTVGLLINNHFGEAIESINKVINSAHFPLSVVYLCVTVGLLINNHFGEAIESIWHIQHLHAK